MLCYCLQREIGDWIAPQGYDHADAEANHLIYNADKNKVGISKVPYKYSKPMNTKTRCTLCSVLYNAYATSMKGSVLRQEHIMRVMVRKV